MPALLFAGLVVAINVVVSLVPDGQYKRQFKAALEISREMGDEAKVVLFGDSRATMFHTDFFEEKTLSFAASNNTVVFSKLVFDRMIEDTRARPRVMIVVLGANNYNENGIFPLRDFAIRRLATHSDIRGFLRHPGGYRYALDAIFARFFKVYGRRVEIRSPGRIEATMKLARREIGRLDVPGMAPLEMRLAREKHVRSAVADQNYWLIYRRSVYCNYELSGLHAGMLEELVDNGLRHGATVVLVQAPVEPLMRQLERELVRNVFDDYMSGLKARKPIVHLDLRDDRRFEFSDLNHLSLGGGRVMTEEILNPLIADILDSGTRSLK